MILNTEWDKVVGKEFEKPYLKSLLHGINLARDKGKIIYPKKGKIFTIFQECDYDKVKVVILGQNPYPTSNADGIAFNYGNPMREKYPKALLKIMQTINKQVYHNEEKTIHNDLINWANQGVFLLNTILTVTKSESLSHAGKGWETFTANVFKSICEKRTPVVYLLWGQFAQQYKQLIRYSNHLVISCEHPTASFYDGDREWQNNDCFNKCNEYLIANNLKPIEWNEELPF